MMIVLVLLGCLIALVGLVVVLRPDAVLGYADRHAGQPALYVFAVVIRLVLGIVLLRYADRSSFPLTLSVIGWISIVAAVFLIVIGRERLERLIHWAVRFAIPWGRLAGVIALLFGAFIVYAVV